MTRGSEALKHRSARVYHLYGLSLRSDWPLPYPRGRAATLAEVGLLQGSRSRFSNAFKEVRASTEEARWDWGVPLASGQTYVRGSEHFEFLISSDGRVILGRSLREESHEPIHTYLLGQALSFALIKQGFEPLHATAVNVDGGAVAFLGESGYGKSSLGAAFVQAGHQILTDDLLVLSERDGRFTAYPGPPRIKLYPEVAGIVLLSHLGGTPIGRTTKLVIPLDEHQVSASAVPLQAIYVLGPPRPRGGARKHVTIRRLSKRQACFALLQNPFNTAVIDSKRLSRQFAFATTLAASVPVKFIRYPRIMKLLPAVREAILSDVRRARNSAGGEVSWFSSPDPA